MALERKLTRVIFFFLFQIIGFIAYSQDTTCQNIYHQLNQIPAYKQLDEDYASDIQIDRVTIKVSLAEDKINKYCMLRMQYVTNTNIDYDFTFFQNKNGEIFKVYDNINNKEYSIKDWKKLMD